MPNGSVCEHHTDMAVKVGQHDTRLNEGDDRMTKIERSVEKIEGCVDSMKSILWKWAGAIMVIVALASIFGPSIAVQVMGHP
jgi:hypothetical protein